MHGDVIDVPINMNQIQSIRPHLPHNDVAIGVFFKWCFEYKLLHMSKNVLPNMVIITLWI